MIQELLATAQILCANLDRAIAAERKFNDDVQYEFQKMKRQQQMWMDNLTAIKERFGDS